MHKLPLLLIALFLTGCAMSPQGMIDQGALYLRETQRARIEAEEQRQLEEARLRNAAEWEIAQIQAASQATMDAWNILQSQGDATAAAGRATAAQAAVIVNSTMTAIPIQATQTAVPLQATASYMAAERKETFEMVKLTIVGGIMVSIAVTLAIFFWRLGQWIPEWIDMRRRVVATGAHLIAWQWDDEGGERRAVLLAGEGASKRWTPPTAMLPQTVPDVIMSRNGITATSARPIEHANIDLRALGVIEASISHNGGASNVLVGYRDAKMGGSTWTRAMSSLKAYGIIRKVGNSYVLNPEGKYQSLHEICGDLKSGRLKLPTVQQPDTEFENIQLNSFIEDEADKLQKEGFFKI